MKKFILLTIIFLLVGCTSENNFTYWHKEADSIHILKEYVKTVQDPKSEHYIPEDDRIAIFDFDGTIFQETAPIYSEWLIYRDYVLANPLNFDQELVDFALELDGIKSAKDIPSGTESRHIIAHAKAFAGMSVKDYMAFVRNFKEKEAEGYQNLQYKDAFYKPMLEVIDYLLENDFIVYICSGTNRFTVRTLAEDVLPLKPRFIIGSDFTLDTTSQEETLDHEYQYHPEEEVLMGEDVIIKNIKTAKIDQIVQEIGQKPVLIFANSTGDYAMSHYATKENPYLTKVFYVINDDLDREYGNLKKASQIIDECEKNNWIPISMANDWKTIYGDNVTLDK